MQICFNEVFRRLRRDRDLTQEQAADIFGVSPQAVSRWETGSACPDIAMLMFMSPAIAPVAFSKALTLSSLGAKAILTKYLSL